MSFALALALLVPLVSGEPGEAAGAHDSQVDCTLATVNTSRVTKSQVERRIAIVRKNMRSAVMSLEQALEVEINRRLLIQAAEREFGEKPLERLRAVAAERAAAGADPRKPAPGADDETAHAMYEDILLSAYLDRKVTSTIRVTPAEMRAHYEANLEAYATPESVTIRQILARVGERYSDEARSLVEAAAARVGEGQDFAKVATEVSEGPYSASGGLWPPQGRGVLVREVEEVAFSLAPGETSAPFQSPLGWHVVRVEERTGRSARPFNQVQEEIERDLVTRKRIAAETELLEKLKSKAVVIIMPR